MKLINEFESIRNWADAKGIYDKGDKKTQLIKLFEEAGELSKAILNNDEDEIIDAIGDCVVVLTNLCVLCKMYKENPKNIGLIEQIQIEDCINSAYNVIANRKGKMQNGTFVKDAK
jgi:NTP pyrophosphatase (non-canonical NTP hydrolase)